MRGKDGDGETKSAGRELDGRARVLLLFHIYNREPQYSSSDKDILLSPFATRPSLLRLVSCPRTRALVFSAKGPL